MNGLQREDVRTAIKYTLIYGIVTILSYVVLKKLNQPIDEYMPVILIVFIGMWAVCIRDRFLFY